MRNSFKTASRALIYLLGTASLPVLAWSGAAAQTAPAADASKRQDKTQSRPADPAPATITQDATAAPAADPVERAREDDANPVSDDIVVTGIRRAIQASIDQKRDATNFVDTVVAEDIGKFPDANLAEALQRVPGVTITRNRGEGQNISVRGLGGDYNITTLIGRRLATESTGREFNYDVLEAELVGGLQVFKTPLAELPEGGIGSIVNINTRRPFDIGKFKVAASGRAEYESRTGRVNPTVSALISAVSPDNRFGILASATYSRRTLRQDSYIGEGFLDVEDGSYVSVPFDTNRDGVISPDGGGLNRPGPGSEYYKSLIPGYTRYSIAQDTRERLGGSVALQWRVSDQVIMTLEGLASRYDFAGTDYQIAFVNWDEPWTPGIPQIDEIRRADDGRVNYIKVGGRPVAEILNAAAPRRTSTYQVGFNIAGKGDLVSWDFDVARSQARNRNAGDNRYVVARAVLDSYTIDATGDTFLPSITINPAISRNTPFGAHYTFALGTGVTDTLTEARLGATISPRTFLDQIRVGLSVSSQRKERRQFQSADPSAFSNGGINLTRRGLPFDRSLVGTFGNLSLFTLPQDVFQRPAFDKFLSGEKGTHPAPWPSFDYDRLFAYYETINADAANRFIAPTFSPTASYAVTEELMNGYIRATFREKLFGMPFTLDVGGRRDPDLADRDRIARGPPVIGPGAAGSAPVAGPGQRAGELYRYPPQHELPAGHHRHAADARVRRQGHHPPAARPAVAVPGDRPGQPPHHPEQPAPRPVPGGSGRRRPGMVFAKASLLSGALYYKKINSFIVNDIRRGTEFGQEWEIREPINSRFGGEIKGFEIAAQTTFDGFLPIWARGFGTQINYTYTTSSFQDPELAGLPFTGMSKTSYNVVGFFERDGFGARLAYNRRGRFIVDPFGWGGPTWTAGYGQLDASATLSITKNAALTLDAINLGNARYYQYVGDQKQVSYVGRFGRQIAAGVRIGF